MNQSIQTEAQASSSNILIASNLLKLFFPIVGSSLTSCLVSIIAMMMIAHLGKISLAAGALASSTYITLAVICFGMLFVISILIANAKGAGKKEDIRIIMQNGGFVVLAMGAILAITLENITSILFWFHQDPHLIALTVPFFHYIGLGIIPILFIVLFSQFFIGIGKPRINFFLTISQSIITLFLSYGFIFGKWGLPSLGLGGYAYALAITATIQSIATVVFIQWHPFYKAFGIFSTWPRFHLDYFKKIIFIGVPIGVQFGGELAAFTVSVYMMGWFGPKALAEQQIVTQASLLSIMIMMGFTQAASVMVAHAHGRKNYELVLKITKIAALLGTSVMCIIAMIYCYAPQWIIMWFLNINDPDNAPIIAGAKLLLLVAAVMQIIDCIRDVLNGALRGLQDSKTSMWVGLCCNWLISLPLCYFLGFVWQGGPAGLRSGFIFGFLLCVIILIFRLIMKVKSLQSSEVEKSQTIVEEAILLEGS